MHYQGDPTTALVSVKACTVKLSVFGCRSNRVRIRLQADSPPDLQRARVDHLSNRQLFQLKKVSMTQMNPRSPTIKNPVFRVPLSSCHLCGPSTATDSTHGFRPVGSSFRHHKSCSKVMYLGNSETEVFSCSVPQVMVLPYDSTDCFAIKQTVDEILRRSNAPGLAAARVPEKICFVQKEAVKNIVTDLPSYTISPQRRV